MRRIPPTIAILTDFGVNDNYNGVMEAVIRKVNPEARIIYISGNVKNFNIYAGAYLLYTSFKYFPKNTIFLVVIDPGVGTNRRPLIIKTLNYIFVGPDNGVLFQAAEKDGIEKIIEINNPKLYLSNIISNTFHGRDIFSITAAFLSLGVDINIFGKELRIDDINKINLITYKVEDKRICGKVAYIDHFGNIATSIPIEAVIGKIEYNRLIKITVNNSNYMCRFVKTFGYGNENELLIYQNGYFLLEIGINKGNAKDKIDVKEGDEICLEVYIQEDSSHSI
ncbi:MAG: S-adenosyl-l-methionine hydroxide adenosyltransferase family protein [Sulfolobaceae archaeon]